MGSVSFAPTNFANLLADRPAPRGAAGGAGGGPPCKSKKTTFKIFLKKQLLPSVGGHFRWGVRLQSGAHLWVRGPPSVRGPTFWSEAHLHSRGPPSVEGPTFGSGAHHQSGGPPLVRSPPFGQGAHLWSRGPHFRKQHISKTTTNERNSKFQKKQISKNNKSQKTTDLEKQQILKNRHDKILFFGICCCYCNMLSFLKSLFIFQSVVF